MTSPAATSPARTPVLPRPASTARGPQATPLVKPTTRFGNPATPPGYPASTLAFLLLLFLLLPLRAHAHSANQAALLLDYHAESIDAELQLPPSRVQSAYHQAPAVLEPYLLARLHITSTGAPWTITPTAPPTLETIDGAPYLVARFRLLPPPGASVRSLTLTDDILHDALPTQVTLVSVRSDWSSSTFANDPDLLGVLTSTERTLTIDRGRADWRKGFASVFRLGTRHIAEGTDHLLFLFALLLPAPLLWSPARWLFFAGRWTGFAGVRHGLTQILKVVTAFTLGHSLTLALAASGAVHVPPQPIEVLIALSILVSAIHAARPIFPGREALIAAAFGLIHGLAFASTLAELGLHRFERVASIFAFNCGIEAMQLLVVLCTMPSLMLLSRTRLYPAFRLAGAAFAALAALGWALNRTFALTLPVDPAVDTLTRHPAILALTLFLAALAATRLPSPPRSPESSA